MAGAFVFDDVAEDQAAACFRLRRARRPSPARPVAESGSVAGSGVTATPLAMLVSEVKWEHSVD
jgi:hypothetical protein